ncbi:DUF6578 domain-containing protein [Cellulomonas terrae]|uniref:Uncharacterized protein n=1 Tax=Cellulomonas terrae TaxID=311234 RepID=A0A511JN43_9CELL|nr:DUF6578 domain-containing protein [Cellulomonas terrae]GEL98993.1 hypothetical protein CTE05_25400 [Cellulomonas terrae]
MDLLVWYSSWQLQCCGDVFGVGDWVAWDCRETDLDWLESALGPEVAGRISWAEEHHDVLPDGHPVARGTVVEIQAAFCRFALGADQRVSYPVPGTTVLRQVTHADGTEHDPSGARFLGYVVEVAVQPEHD